MVWICGGICDAIVFGWCVVGSCLSVFDVMPFFEYVWCYTLFHPSSPSPSEVPSTTGHDKLQSTLERAGTVL